MRRWSTNRRREGQDYEALEDERAKILSSLVCCSPYPSFIGIYVKETFFLLFLGWDTARAMYLDKDSTWPKQRKLAVHAEQRAQDAGAGKAELREEGEAKPLIDEGKRMVWREIVFYDLEALSLLGRLVPTNFVA